jgi:hypothetical protein
MYSFLPMPRQNIYRAVVVLIIAIVVLQAQDKPRHITITGKSAFADFTQEKPGVFRKITLADLPPPLRQSQWKMTRT